MSNAFEYITEVLKIAKDPEENNQDFFQRVAVELQNLNEDDWNALPDDLQEWYNKAADVIASASEEETVTIEMIPGMSAKKAKAKKAETEETEGEETEKPKRGRKPKAEKAEKAPRVKKEKEPKEPKGPTAANAVREILCENMDLSLDDIMSKLEEREVVMKRSSMQVVALNTKQAFVIAAQVGTVKNAEGEVVLQKG
jgi:hypothetical protein